MLRHLLGAPDRRLRRVDLAELLGLTPSGIARMLAPLEKLGHVARESDPRDARVALVTLTDAGAARTQEAQGLADERATALFERVLDDEERTRGRHGGRMHARGGGSWARPGRTLRAPARCPGKWGVGP